MTYNLVNYLNPSARKKLGDTSQYNIVPIGFSSDFEEYHALGVQQPKHPITFQQMRHIAEKSVWIEAAITAIADVIGSLSFQIVPRKQYMHLFGEDEKMQRARSYLEWLFTMQNATHSGFSDLRKAVVRDLLTFDGAVIELVRTANDPDFLTKDTDVKGRIVAPIARDASTFYIDYDEHQVIRRFVQVGMRGRQAMPMTEDNLIYNIDIGGSFAVFDRNDIIYMRLKPKSGSAYGTPPVVSLLSAIQADLAADANIGRHMSTGGIIPGIIVVEENLDTTVVKRYEAAFRRIQRAGARELPMVSGAGKTQYIPFGESNREMELNKLQEYMMKKILAVYKTPPHVLGLTDGINRSIAFAQHDNFYAGAINPIKVYLEEVFTERIVAEFDHRLRFEFLEPNATDKQSRYQEIQIREELGMIDDNEKFIYAGVEPPQKESSARIMRDLQQETTKVDLELKKLQVQQLRQGLRLTENNAQMQQQQVENQQRQMEQQQHDQQKQLDRQAVASGGGVKPFDAMASAQEGYQKASSFTGSTMGSVGRLDEPERSKISPGLDINQHGGHLPHDATNRLRKTIEVFRNGSPRGALKEMGRGIRSNPDGETLFSSSEKNTLLGAGQDSYTNPMTGERKRTIQGLKEANENMNKPDTIARTVKRESNRG